MKSYLAFALRMMLLIHTLQPIQRQMRVHLRGRNIGMTRMVCTVRRSAPFSTMCVAQLWRSMCGLACRPEAADAARTICQTRWRVSLRPPRAMKRNGEFRDEFWTVRSLSTSPVAFRQGPGAHRQDIPPAHPAQTFPTAQSVPCRPCRAPACSRIELQVFQVAVANSETRSAAA